MTVPPGEWTTFDDLCQRTPVIGPGARYISVEFHCHTPASDDYVSQDPGKYDEIARALADRGIDSVFVTDHNTWEGIAPLDAATKRLGGKTQVYPGVELSVVAPAARIGEGLSKDDRKIKEYFFHILVFLPPSPTAAKQIESLVTNNHNDLAILKLKPTERKLAMSLEEIAVAVHSWGGIVLVAHFHQGKAPEKSRSHDDIYSDALAIKDLTTCFDAVEIRQVSSDIFFDGAHNGDNDQPIPEKVCVLGSDAHRPEDVGVEPTWVLVENNTFDDVKTSLKYRERVLFQAPAKDKDVLLHLVIEGTFLGTLHMEFNAEMSAFIGTKGAGKSAVLECVRFALGIPSVNNIDDYLNHILGPSGRVSLSVRNRHGEEFLFVRSRAEPTPRVFGSTGSAMERAAVIPGNFPVEIRGWGEITKLAEDKASQLRLLDAFDTTGAAVRSFARIRETRSKLPERHSLLTQIFTRLRETKTELDELSLKKERLNKLQVAKIVDVQAAKEKRDSELASYRELLGVLQANQTASYITFSSESAEQIRSLRAAIERRELTPPTSDQAETALAKALSQESELARNSADTIKLAENAVAACIRELETSFETLESEYAKSFAELDANEQDVLLKRNEIVREIARLPTVQGRFDQLVAELEQGFRAYAGLLDELQTATTDRANARKQVLETLNARLTTAKIATRLKLETHSQVTGSLPSGQKAATVFGALANEFRTATAAEALQRSYSFFPTTPREEFSLEIDDRPAIEFELYHDVWRQSEQLSAGQKSTAVLPLIIMLGEGPVILDQPEDNLDNKYIGAVVVRMAMTEKRRRQFIFTSHNATLVVMSDANVVVEMVDQEGKAAVVRSGFLNGPHSSIKGSVLEVLDGGEAALKRRFSRYGLAEASR